MPAQEQEVKSEDEKVDPVFLAERLKAEEARERRRQLLKDVAADSKDPTEHLMEEVDKIRAQPSERQLKWEAFKKEQQDFISSKSSGSRDSAVGDLKRRPKYTGQKQFDHRRLLQSRSQRSVQTAEDLNNHVNMKLKMLEGFYPKLQLRDFCYFSRV